MEQFQNIAAQAQKPGAVALARAFQIDRDDALDAARARGHDNDSIARVYRFFDVVCAQLHRSPAGLSETQDLILHSHPSESVERAKELTNVLSVALA